VVRTRCRGMKGSELGKPSFYRFIRREGLATVMWPTLLAAKWSCRRRPVFNPSSSAFLRALRRQDPRYTLHSVKRGCACHMANAGADMEDIRRHLGHKSVEMTRLYVQPRAAQKEIRRQLRWSKVLL
jgi:integrase